MILLTSLSARADLVFWTPTGQEATYVLPAGVSPQKYLQKMQSNRSLGSFTRRMHYSPDDRVEIRQPDPKRALTRALLIANKDQDHERVHSRLDLFGRHFEKTFVVPVGAVLGLKPVERHRYYFELGQHFGLLSPMGGADVAPSLYRSNLTWSVETNELRDILEAELIRYFYYQTDRKIYGTCRGMQLTAVVLGARLNQDISRDLMVSEMHQDGVFHPLFFETTEHNILMGITAPWPHGKNGEITILSYHHQSLDRESLKETSLQVSAVSPDGVIEAAESRDGRVLLVQFHPEMKENEKLFRDLFFRALKLWMREPSNLKDGRLCQKLF